MIKEKIETFLLTYLKWDEDQNCNLVKMPIEHFRHFWKEEVADYVE